ncbi:hypothetical protein [Nocardioides sp.]|uniref:hypothetical protein n=1 Tax=Nocardioides sp. TaxID=35761 RepID=UPI002ED2CE72
MRSFRILIAAVLLGAGLALGAPAFACSCVAQTPAQYAEGADVVFAGTLTDIDEPRQFPVVSSAAETRYTFDVDAVYAGDPAPVTRVGSAWSGASCGLEGMDVGERYVVFAYVDGKQLDASLCGGTGLASPRLEGKVGDVLGPAALPDPGGQHGGQPPLPSPATAWAWVAGLFVVAVPLWWLWSRRTVG